MSAIAYRREIDGLRALAVVPVLLYHAEFAFFSGGYVGVDIFFVISGYLITSILLREIDGGDFSLARFYERRVRRILPTLYVVMLASLPFAALTLLPSQVKPYLDSIRYTTVFISNFLFAREAGYFDTDSGLKPFIHTWSLGVEEQFYILFPILFFLAIRFLPRRLLGVMALAALASLVWAEIDVADHPVRAFYMLQTRFWELLLGAMAAVTLTRHRAAFDRFLGGDALAEILGLVGLALIAVSVVGFDEATPFPSLWALVPTGGALLVILFASGGTLAARALSLSPLVAIGLVSYSAYLWHQPVFAFYRAFTFTEPGTAMAIGLIGVTFAASYLSWRFVETPFRDRARMPRPRLLKTVGAGTLVLLAVSTLGALAPDRVTARVTPPSVAATRTVLQSRCHIEKPRAPERLAAGDFCKLGADVPVSFAVIGDSHAGALFDAFAAAAEAQGRSFDALSGGFCAPLLNGFRLERYAKPRCPATMAAGLSALIADPAIETIVLYAEWANYTKGHRDDAIASIVLDDDGPAASVADNPAVFERSLKKTVAAIRAAGKRVVVIGPTPEFAQPVFERLSVLYNQGLRDGSLAKAAPAMPLAAYEARNREVLEAFGRLEGAEIVDTRPLFCTDGSCPSTTPDELPLFHDANHVSWHGAERLVEAARPLVFGAR